MGTTQSHNLLIAEPHSTKHMPQMIASLSTIWQSTSWRQFRIIDIICASPLPINLRSAHLFDRHNTSERPQIRVRDPWIFGLDLFPTSGQENLLSGSRTHGFQKHPRMLKTCISGIATFGFVSHACSIRTAGIGFFVIRSRGMPSQMREQVSQGFWYQALTSSRTYHVNRTSTGPALPSSYSG